MNRRYADVAARAGHRCEYCHAPEAIFNFPFEVEHIIPSNRGGEDDLSNLGLACRSCNLYKGDSVFAADPEVGKEEPLFSPRTEVWDDHFLVDVELGTISGRSPVGRATIACLRMNADSQIAARRQWMRLGLFP